MRTQSDPQAQRRLSYFIRDDDVGPLTDALQRFVRAFAACRLPVSYQIIPERLTPDCARFLIDAQNQHPDLIEFGQHGLAHQMWVRGRLLNREFGPERSAEQQRSDILRGRELLKQRLGDAADPIIAFTPPQHKFDHNTVVAAAEAGHRVFSVSNYPTARHQAAYAFGRAFRLGSLHHHGISYHGELRPEAVIREVSISVDVDDGRKIKYPADKLAPAVRAAAARSAVVGLMLHHELYADADQALVLTGIMNQLAGLGIDNFVRLGGLAGDLAVPEPAATQVPEK